MRIRSSGRRRRPTSFRRRKRGSARSWVVEEEGEVVACATLALFVRPPYPGNLAGREGYLLNIYTRPAWRRRGMANAPCWWPWWRMPASSNWASCGSMPAVMGALSTNGSALPAIPPASSAYLPVSLLFFCTGLILFHKGCVLGALGGIAAFSIHCALHSFQSSDHLCRRWRCRYPLWVRPWCPWGWSTRKKCHVQSEAQSAVAGMSDPARRGAGHRPEAIKAGAATVIFSPEGSSRRRAPFPGPDGIWCRRTDWAAPQPALSEGLGSPVTIASSGGVSLRGGAVRHLRAREPAGGRRAGWRRPISR